MWLGAWMSRADEPLGPRWVRKMKVLGVVFGTVSCEEDNWEPKIKKFEKSLNLWRSRLLSLLGKALIINTLGLSKLVYLAKVLILPDWVLTRVNALIWPFIWGCKMDTLSRNTCYLTAATCKYHLQLCKIEKSKIVKLCHNKGFRSLITKILVSVHSCKYFSIAATFPSRTLQVQANRLKIPLLYDHSLEVIIY